MSTQKKASLSLITPRGIAIYPKLNKPDFKFAKEGSYEAKISIQPDADDAVIGKKAVTQAELMTALEKLRDDFLEEKKEELASSRDPKAKAKARSISVKEVGEPGLDADGNEDGTLVLKGKMKASGISPRDGKKWERSPVIFDAAGKPLKVVPEIYGGSTLKIAAKAVPYYIPAENVVGVSLYMEAVQLIDLVTGGGRSASAYGFGAEEGYEGDDSVPADDDAPFPTGEEGGENEDF